MELDSDFFGIVSVQIHFIIFVLQVERKVKLKLLKSLWLVINLIMSQEWKKFKYQSHGLRFDVKRSLETDEAFNQRINKQMRDEEDGFEAVEETGKWFLGDQLRRLGSLHSDTWTGSASELANRGYIGVYPVLGWWRERAALERWGNQARYTLVVSIRAPETEVDLYTPILNAISTTVEI